MHKRQPLGRHAPAQSAGLLLKQRVEPQAQPGATLRNQVARSVSRLLAWFIGEVRSRTRLVARTVQRLQVKLRLTRQGDELMVGRVAASAIASASQLSFFCP